jgi:hypothetical protein
MMCKQQEFYFIEGYCINWVTLPVIEPVTGNTMIDHRNKIPYILAYKSRNFGQILDKILSIRLIRGSKLLT